MKALCLNAKEAWNEIIYKGRAELGKRQVNPTSEYEAWLKEKIAGINPAYASQDPLRGNNISIINGEIRKRLAAREGELQELQGESSKDKEELTRLREECTALKNELAGEKRARDLERIAEVKRLKEENRKLRNSLRDKETESTNSKARLMKLAKAKNALEKQAVEDGFIDDLQQEVRSLSKLLQKRTDELSMVRGSTAETIQNLVDKLNQQTEDADKWRSLYLDRTEETKEWMERCKRMITLANEAIPSFAWEFRRAEGMVNPMNTPPEITEFFALCTRIISELQCLTKF